jgi:preprotein translocase subunit SecY
MNLIEAVQRAWKLPDLRARILFVLGMLLAFRAIAHIPVPNIDSAALDQLQQSLQSNQLAQLLNIFSGGALKNFSVAALGVYPYITATIIMQLLQPLIPALEELAKEGEQGRIKLNRYQTMMTVPLAALHAYGQTVALQHTAGQSLFRSEFNLVTNFFPTFTIILSMTAGTMLLVWLGELINQHGIGNGISVIIFGGIVSGVPGLVWQGIEISQVGDAQSLMGLVLFLAIGLLTILGIVYIQEGQRRIPVQYAKQVRGNRVYGGQRSHIPLKVNMAGMIPLIFAQSIIIFPGVVASWFLANEGVVGDIASFIYNVFTPSNVGTNVSMGDIVYIVALFLLVVGFTYFYTMVLFSQQNIPDNLQKHGGFIPGIRPGKKTEEYLSRVLNRITLAGALFLGLVAVLPFITQTITNIQIGLGGAALLIVVGVAVDTLRQLEAQLMMRDYEGFIRS